MALKSIQHGLATTSTLVVCFVACDEKRTSERECPNDMPTGWSCPDERVITIGEPPAELAECATPPEPPPPGGMVRRESSGLHLDLTALWFRENQELCAFSETHDVTLRVLVQPCDVHPDFPDKGSCYYYATIALGSVSPSVSEVQVFTRTDFPENETEEPRIFGNFPIPS
jgi:hypothetical protein